MKKTFTLYIFLLFTAELSFAQKQTSWWFFGQNAGLHFDSGVALPVLTGALNTSGGSSVISDTSGNLLFYTDGVTVFNRENAAMPNGFGLFGSNFSTQSALIAPIPGSANLYYIFTVNAASDTNVFRYSVVDMTLNDSLGDVFVKNKFIHNNLPEKITAVATTDGSGYWVLTHEWGSNAFYAYSVTTNGLDSMAVISNVGTVYSSSMTQNDLGQLKFSPDGKKIAAAIGYQGIFELLDFDPSTGTVSNPIDINTGGHCYGVEFSADNSKLYVTYYDPFVDAYYLNQYDISSGDATTINNSKIILSNTSEDLRSLQLGPDRKIYVVPAFAGSLSVINDPDSAGAASDYEDDAVDLGGSFCSLGLPGFIQSYFNEGSISTGIQNLSRASLAIFPNPAADKIYFGLPSSNSYYIIELKNETGAIVFSKQFDQKPGAIDVSHLANGIYLVSIKSPMQNFEGKFLKQ